MAAFPKKRRAVASSTKTCSHCGAQIAARAKACRECGSDAETGWKDADELDLAAVELPEFDADDYQAVIDDIEGRSAARVRQPRWIVWVTWLVLLALILLFVFARA
jgi:ribosomal protein L40E